MLPFCAGSPAPLRSLGGFLLGTDDAFVVSAESLGGLSICKLSRTEAVGRPMRRIKAPRNSPGPAHGRSSNCSDSCLEGRKAALWRLRLCGSGACGCGALWIAEDGGCTTHRDSPDGDPGHDVEVKAGLEVKCAVHEDALPGTKLLWLSSIARPTNRGTEKVVRPGECRTRVHPFFSLD